MATAKKPRFRRLDYAALVASVEGPTTPDVVYQFGRRKFYERPGRRRVVNNERQEG